MKLIRWMAPALLIACSAPEVRVPAPLPVVTDQVAIQTTSIEVREVSLPSYAALEDIFLQDAGGTLASMEGLLWADDPTRAFTLGLTRTLNEVTGRLVAPEPWPFDTFPGARVDVRVEDFLADPSGNVRLQGQVFVADLDGSGRAKSLHFNLQQTAVLPLAPSGLADARSQLIADLAVFIARNGLR